MRLHIQHDLKIGYADTVYSVVQQLRLMPRSYSGQFVRDWRLEVSEDSRMKPLQDAYGNFTHTFSIEGPLDTLEITAIGEIETEDRNGLVADAVERLPAGIFLRSTPLTAINSELTAWAGQLAEKNDPRQHRIELMHAVNLAVNEEIEWQRDADPMPMGAVKLLTAKKGGAGDLAHLVAALLRSVGVPTRIVGGYRYDADGADHEQSVHVWAESYLDGMGWIGLDPCLAMSPTDAYVRVAAGIDYLDVTPVRTVGSGTGQDEINSVVSIKNLDA